MTTEQLNPTELTVHPLAKPMPEWDAADERFRALTKDVADEGILQPLIVDSHDRVVDGRHRRRAALKLKLETVPCLRCKDEDVPGIILSTLIQRRHYTLGQRAYLSYPVIEPAHQAAKARHVERLKAGGKATLFGTISDSIGNAPTAKDFAATIGVSRDTFDQAAKLHGIFDDHPELREQFEPQILDGEEPKGLGGVLAGIGFLLKNKGKQHPGGKPAGADKQLQLFTGTFHTLETRFEYWEKFAPDQKAEALDAWRDTLRAMPEEMFDGMAAVVATERRKRAGNSTEGNEGNEGGGG